MGATSTIGVLRTSR